MIGSSRTSKHLDKGITTLCVVGTFSPPLKSCLEVEVEVCIINVCYMNRFNYITLTRS